MRDHAFPGLHCSFSIQMSSLKVNLFLQIGLRFSPSLICTSSKDLFTGTLLMKNTMKSWKEEEKSLEPKGIQTHNLMITRSVLYHCPINSENAGLNNKVTSTLVVSKDRGFSVQSRSKASLEGPFTPPTFPCSMFLLECRFDELTESPQSKQ